MGRPAAALDYAAPPRADQAWPMGDRGLTNIARGEALAASVPGRVIR